VNDINTKYTVNTDVTHTDRQTDRQTDRRASSQPHLTAFNAIE